MSMEKHEPSWGIRPPGVRVDEPLYWWGARAIYHKPQIHTTGRGKKCKETVTNPEFELLDNRTTWGDGFFGKTESVADRAQLKWFLYEVAFRWLRHWCAKKLLGLMDPDLFEVKFLSWTFQASTHASGGYMYMGCWTGLRGERSFAEEVKELVRQHSLRAPGMPKLTPRILAEELAGGFTVTEPAQQLNATRKADTIVRFASRYSHLGILNCGKPVAANFLSRRPLRE